MAVVLFSCQAILFDLDGVLVDSRAVIERHWRAWAEEAGVDPEAILRAAPGMRTADTIRLVAPHLDAEAEAARIDAGETRDVEGVVAEPGSSELVAVLVGLPWAVVTSGSRPLAVARLGRAGLASPPVLITGDDVAKGKPAPDPYLLAARRLGVRPADCVVIEDAPAGIGAALAAGMRVVGLATTHAADELHEADAVVLTLGHIEVSRQEKDAGLQLVARLGP